MELEQLTPRVYQLPFSQENDRPALGYIRGDRFSLMVDAGNSPEHVRDYQKAVENAGTLRCCNIDSFRIVEVAIKKIHHMLWIKRKCCIFRKTVAFVTDQNQLFSLVLMLFSCKFLVCHDFHIIIDLYFFDQGSRNILAFDQILEHLCFAYAAVCQDNEM